MLLEVLYFKFSPRCLLYRASTILINTRRTYKKEKQGTLKEKK